MEAEDFDQSLKFEDARVPEGVIEVKFEEDDRQLIESLGNDAVYIGKRLSTNVNVPQNIHKMKYRKFWEENLECSDLCLDVIRSGYRLPFLNGIPPPESHEKNNKSARKDMDFVRAEVYRLEKLNCIQRVQERPFITLPLSSVFSKKKRVVVDASRALNPFLQHRRVRLQDHRDVGTLVKAGYWFAVEDLDSGYWHVAINESHKKYLGIEITSEDGKSEFFVWNVLFLGVADAVWLFTMILRPVRKYLASHGIPNIIYLDDCLVCGIGQQGTQRNRDFAVETLGRAGFVVSTSKSKGPAPRLEFLGLEIDGNSLKFYVPQKKIEKMKDTITKLVKAEQVSVRQIASVVGLIQSFKRAIGSITRMYTRKTYCWMAAKLEFGYYGSRFVLDDEVKKELMFWFDNLERFNGYSFSPELSTCEARLVVVSDASEMGLFAFQYFDKYEIIAARRFTEEEAKMSSTKRELLALHAVYVSNAADKFKNSKVDHYTDNQAVESIMEIGSRKPELQNLVLEIVEACREKRTELKVVWKPRDHFLLKHADLGSKSFDDGDYTLDFNSFSLLLETFPEVRFDVDCMSNVWNTKAKIFFSKFDVSNNSGVNFFSQTLFTNLSYYCFPPPSLIVPALLHLAKYEVEGLLLVPVWKSSAFWTRICPDGRHLPRWSRKVCKFKPSGFVVDEKIISETFRKPTFEMLAIAFNFKVREIFQIQSEMWAALAKANSSKPKTSASAALAKAKLSKPKTSVFDKLPAPAEKSSSRSGAFVKRAEKKEEPLAGFGSLPPSPAVTSNEREEKRSQDAVQPSSAGLSSSQFVLSDHSYALSDTSEAASSKDVTSNVKTLTELLPEYLSGSVRESTKKVYDSYWKRYETFCRNEKLKLSSAKSLSMFLIFIAQDSKGASAAHLAKSALKFHLQTRYPFRKCQVNSLYVSRVLKTVNLKFKKPVSKAKTLSSENIVELVLKLLCSGSFKDERAANFFMLAFVAFARYEEISKLRPENVRFLQSGDVELEFPSAKNYNVWDAKKTTIGRNKNPEGCFHPMKILRTYMNKIGGAEYLFPNFKRGKNGNIKFLNEKVSYENMLKCLREGLASIKLADSHKYSLHSIRTGAVSEAVNSNLVDKETIQRHVRWKSPEMVQYYAELSLEKKLEASLSLNLYRM